MDTTPDLGSDSFLLSNMTAQAPDFNQGGWRDLEAHILQLAIERRIRAAPRLEDDPGGITFLSGIRITLQAYYFMDLRIRW